MMPANKAARQWGPLQQPAPSLLWCSSSTAAARWDSSAAPPHCSASQWVVQPTWRPLQLRVATRRDSTASAVAQQQQRGSAFCCCLGAGPCGCRQACQGGRYRSRWHSTAGAPAGPQRSSGAGCGDRSGSLHLLARTFWRPLLQPRRSKHCCSCWSAATPGCRSVHQACWACLHAATQPAPKAAAQITRAIVAAGGNPLLVCLLGSGSDTCQVFAATVIATVAALTLAHPELVAAAGATQVLVQLLSSSNNTTVVMAAELLCMVASLCPASRASIAAKGVVTTWACVG